MKSAQIAFDGNPANGWFGLHLAKNHCLPNPAKVVHVNASTIEDSPHLSDERIASTNAFLIELATRVRFHVIRHTTITTYVNNDVLTRRSVKLPELH